MTQPLSNNLIPSASAQVLFKNGELNDFYIPTGTVLGKGGYGEVMQGESLLTHSPVAIKVQARSPAVEVEAYALKTLKAVHSVCCRDAFKETDVQGAARIFIIMDLIPEKNIYDAFLDPKNPDKRLTLKEIVSIFYQSFEFLNDLRISNAIFYDLKLKNMVFIRSSCSLTFLDFGSVRHMTQHISLPTAITLSYRAPEHILGGRLTPAFDSWSLACAMIEMITDTPLFRISKNVPQNDRNNYHLQLIAQQIGKPNAEYLKNCKKADHYFARNARFKKDLKLPKQANWKVRIQEAAQLKNWPADVAEQLIDVLSRLLRYENRKTPDVLLKHPLFHAETVVQLIHLPQKTGRMIIKRSSTVDVALTDLKLSNLTFPDLILDFCHSVPKCLHLPKDPEGKYVVILEKDGMAVIKTFSFQDSHELDIRRIQLQFAKVDPTLLLSRSSLSSDPMQVDSSTPVPRAKRSLDFSQKENATESSPFKKSKIEE